FPSLLDGRGNILKPLGEPRAIGRARVARKECSGPRTRLFSLPGSCQELDGQGFALFPKRALGVFALVLAQERKGSARVFALAQASLLQKRKLGCFGRDLWPRVGPRAAG